MYAKPKKKSVRTVASILESIGRDRAMIKEYWTEYSCGRIEVEGLLPADDLREYGKGKLCPCCSKRMVRESFSKLPVKGWLKSGDKWVHPEQVTIDHRYPKSTFPERMFDPDNFELVCYKCNKEKSDFFGSAIVKDVREILDFAKSIKF